MHRRALLLAGLLAACAPLATPPSTGDEGQPASQAAVTHRAPQVRQVEVIGGDEASLRAFIERYLQGFYLDTGDSDTRVWVGRLPDAPRVEVPLPDDAAIVSSIEGPYFALELILDVESSGESVREWFAQALASEGWSLAPIAASGGFVAEAVDLDSYCRTSDDAYLTLTVRELAPAASDVRLSVTLPPEFSACDESYASPGDQGLFGEIPVLVAPPGSFITSGGGGSGSGTAEATASIQTEAGVSDLLETFDRELFEEGWQRLSSTAQEGFAWSTWSVPAEAHRTRHGFLLLLALPVPPPEGEVFALLRLVESR